MAEKNYWSDNENVVEWLRGQKVATVTACELRVQNRIRKLAEKFPDDVEIVADGPENGGYMCAHVPASWIRINPPRQVEMTEEQKQAVAERLRSYREFPVQQA